MLSNDLNYLGNAMKSFVDPIEYDLLISLASPARTKFALP